MRQSITYVGMDVHSDSIAIAILTSRGRRAKQRIIPNDPKTIRQTFKKLTQASDVRCCYEAGPCGFETYRQLSGMGIHCDVIAPSLIPKKPGDRVKTDRRDASKLAHLYRAGELTRINVPDERQEAVRDLVRAREDIRRDLVVARHRMSKFLLWHGRVYRAGTRWTDRYWGWIKQQSFEHYQIQVHHLLERRAELERQIKDVAQSEPYRHATERLSCLRGISVLSAMVLLTEIRDFRRFRHPRQLMAFVGLTPTEISSGPKTRRGHITKTGNTHVRRILVEAAWHYRHPASIGPRVRKLLPGQPPEAVALVKKAQYRLHKRYRKLMGWGKPSQVAITAVARELCGFVWALMTL